MLLENFYKVLGTMFVSTDSSHSLETATRPNGDKIEVRSDPTYHSMYFGYNSSSEYGPYLGQVLTSYGNVGSSSSSNMKMGVVFGDGDTPVTLGDYALSGKLITTLTPAITLTPSRVDNGVTLTAVYNLSNSGTSDVTIKEVGAVSRVYSNTNSNFAQLLCERTVLDAPVTIPAGGVGQVTYTIRFNYPTA